MIRQSAYWLQRQKLMKPDRTRSIRLMAIGISLLALTATAFYLWQTHDMRIPDANSAVRMPTSSGNVSANVGRGDNVITQVPAPAPEAIQASTEAAESAAQIAARAAANASP
jgi:hypothetical protein